MLARLIRLTKGDDRNSNHATTPPAQSRSFFWSSNERATNAEASAASSAASAAEPPAEQEQPPSAAPKPPTPAPEPTFTPPDPPQHPPLRAPQPFLVTPPSERSRSHRNRHSSDSHPSIPTNRLRRDHFPFRPRGGCGGSSGPGRLSGTIAASVTASNQTQTRGAALRRALQEQAAERRRRLLEEEMVLSRALSGVTMRKRGGFAWRPGMEVVIKGAATGNGDVAETGRERMVQERMERQQRMVAKRGGMISGGGGFLRGEVGGY
ncbi:hypothetical protein HK101_010172 [Irineochytrium annulatum]|nr:hypothetical protein HK101_010172 [Irineochytrium annulatum]